MRDLEDGSVKWCLGAGQQPFQHNANANHWIKAAREDGQLHRGVRSLPGHFCQGGRPHPAGGDDLRRNGAPMATPSAAPSSGASRCQHLARRAADVWHDAGVFQALQAQGCLGRAAGCRSQGGRLSRTASCRTCWRRSRSWATAPKSTLYEVLFATPENKKFAWPDPVAKGHDNQTTDLLWRRLVPGKGAVRGVPQIRHRPRARPGAVRCVSPRRCARAEVAGGGKRWPVGGNRMAFQRGVRPLRQERQRDRILWRR